MTLPMMATLPPTWRRRMEIASSTTRQEGFSRKSSGTTISEKSALGNSLTSGILSRSPQSTRAPNAAASWITEYSGMTVSKPRTSLPARARSAMAPGVQVSFGKRCTGFVHQLMAGDGRRVSNRRSVTLSTAEHCRHYQITRIGLHFGFCLLPGVNQDFWLLEYP